MDAGVGDAMGANAINTLMEGLAPEVTTITGGSVNLRILSNLSDRRLARAQAVIPLDLLRVDGMSGETVAQRIESASNFAAVSPHRAATHNKGVMNGIDAVAIATGNDWRAIEAGAHAHAARDGRYGPLAIWWVEAGALRGALELPLAVGTVGDRVHQPRAQLATRGVGRTGARSRHGRSAQAKLRGAAGARHRRHSAHVHGAAGAAPATADSRTARD
jgi:hydroxymethylglutaryl-CoA reductase